MKVPKVLHVLMGAALALTTLLGCEGEISAPASEDPDEVVAVTAASESSGATGCIAGAFLERSVAEGTEGDLNGNGVVCQLNDGLPDELRTPGTMIDDQM